MGQMVLRCLLICAVLLFRHGFSAPAEDSKDAAREISGIYFSLNMLTKMSSNTSTVMKSGCPHNISVHDNALQYDGTVYSFNLAGLTLSTENCTYKTEENETVTVPHFPLSRQVNGSTMYMDYWNMTIPDNVLKCSPGKPDDFFPRGTLAVITIIDRFNISTKEEETPSGRTDYQLVLENVHMGERQRCLYYPELRYKKMKELLQKMMSNPKEEPDDSFEGDDEMKIGRGQKLKFCPICRCQEKLGPHLNLDTIEMSENNSTERSAMEIDKYLRWRPPKVLVHNHRCPLNFSKTLDEVVFEDPEQFDDRYNETRRLAFQAVISKLYEEVKGKFDDQLDEMGNHTEKEMLLKKEMMMSLHRRRVMVMKKGAKCDNNTSPVDKDTVFLFEKEHILGQLENNPFVLDNMEEADEIWSSEIDTIHAFTLHVLRRKKDDEGFSVCTLSNSRRACELLNSTDFCSSFKPLGSMVNESDFENIGIDEFPGKAGQETGDPPRRDENSPGQGDNRTDTGDSGPGPANPGTGEQGDDAGNPGQNPANPGTGEQGGDSGNPGQNPANPGTGEQGGDSGNPGQNPANPGTGEQGGDTGNPGQNPATPDTGEQGGDNGNPGQNPATPGTGEQGGDAGNPGQNPANPGTGEQGGSPSPTATPTPTSTSTPTSSPSPSATPTATSTSTPTPTPTATSSPSPASSPPSPAVSPSNNTSSGLCFPAEAKVELEDGSVIRMDELTVGDSIRDGKGGFSKVILFTHANKEVVSEFVRLATDGADVVLSAKHYIPVSGELMTAESVEEGNIVYVIREGRKMEAVVTKVERVWMGGLFNPQTESGTLAVRMNGDAVVASAYTAAIEPNVAHTLLVPLRMLNNLIGVVVPWSWFKNGNDLMVRMFPSGNSMVAS